MTRHTRPEGARELTVPPEAGDGAHPSWHRRRGEAVEGALARAVVVYSKRSLSKPVQRSVILHPSEYRGGARRAEVNPWGAIPAAIVQSRPRPRPYQETTVERNKALLLGRAHDEALTRVDERACFSFRGGPGRSRRGPKICSSSGGFPRILQNPTPEELQIHQRMQCLVTVYKRNRPRMRNALRAHPADRTPSNGKRQRSTTTRGGNENPRGLITWNFPLTTH